MVKSFCHFYRQRKLEEGLLFTGQFNVALEALLDWLAKKESALAEDTPVHGDLDTVVGFQEVHKVSVQAQVFLHYLLLTFCYFLVQSIVHS